MSTVSQLKNEKKPKNEYELAKLRWVMCERGTLFHTEEINIQR